MKYKDEEKDTIVNTVCSQVSEGQSLIDVLEKNDNFPCRDTFHTWLLSDKIIFDKYARARVMRCEKEFEKILRIADDNTNDYYEDERGNEKVDHENIQRSRLRVDTRKWWLSKVVPKIYGDKTHLIVEPPNNGSSQGLDILAICKPDTLVLLERDIRDAENTKTLTGAIESTGVQEAQEITD